MIIGGVVVAGLVGLAIAAPEIYTGTFSDLGTFLRVAGVAALLTAWAIVARRVIPQPAVAMTVAVVPILVATWIYAWPYLRPPTEVDEAFPPVAVATQDEVPADAAAEGQAADEVPAVDASANDDSAVGSTTSTAPTAPAPTTTVPSGADASAGAAPATTVAPATTIPPTTTIPPPTTTTTTVPAGPVELRRGTFQGLTGHRGSGDAALYRLVDNSILLRFEEVDIGSGPKLVVYVVPGEDRRDLGDAVRVADLTAERGNQNYTVPDGVDLTTGTWTVLVWCTTFDVEVANTTFTA